MSETILLDVQNLSKYYGKVHALKGISFSIKQGEIVGFLGANGAGKSTTMRILSGCMSASDGKVSLLGQDIQSYPIKTKQDIGYLPEQPPLYPQMRVLDYLEFVATIKNSPTPKEAVQIIIERLQLDTVAGRFIDQLSKGYKQRVGLAQALIHSPKLLILDEPTSGLDPLMQNRFFELLEEQSKKDVTIFFSSHNLSEIQRMCDKAAVIRKGEIIAIEDISALLKKQMKKGRFVFKEKPKDVKFPEGIQHEQWHTNKLTFEYVGPLNVLVKWMSGLDLVDAILEEPDLESIFMNYYER